MTLLSEHPGTVALAPGTAADLVAAIRADGWRSPTGNADVILVDARDEFGGVEAAAARALAAGAALLAVVQERADTRAAYEAGATHVAVGADELSDALRLAGRHARRLRSAARSRRSGDWVAAGASSRFIADHRGGGVTVAIVALTSIDIVNAAFGRAAGDALIQSAERRIADALIDCSRIVVREGSSFVITLAAASGRAEALIAEVERELAQPFAIGDETIHAGLRIGIAHAAADEDPDAVLARASEAMARARGDDGARSRVAAAAALPLADLSADLHQAIERDEVEVLFQPQVSLASGRIVGVEALARWRHPRLGALGAEVLFAAAERADLGAALGDHIQALALARVAAWPDALAGLRVALNVTAGDIARPDFAHAFLARMAASGVARARVTVEITEQGLIADLDAAAALLARLRGAGCRVAIDDFGTGYSGLAYLKALPLDYLKIDKSIAQDVTGSARDRVVLEGALAMARSLGLETIAEGVETEEQRAGLAARGCTYYQGFLCAEPLGDAALARLMMGS